MLRRLVGYAVYMFGANTLTGLFTFGVSAFGMVARSKEAFGDYAMYMRVYEIGQGLFIFGANASVQRFAAASPENRLRFAAIALRLFIVLLGVMGASGLGVGLLFGWSYALALFGLPFLVLYWWGRYIVRSNLDARREARLMMVASLSNSVFQFAFLTFTPFRDALIYGDFLALVASGVAALLYLRSGVGASFREILRTAVPLDFIKEAARFGAPVWWSGQLFSVKQQLQAVWTGAGLGKAELGSLQGMTTMWQFSMKPLEYMSQAALPGLVTAKEEQPALYRDVLRFCLASFTLVGIAVAAGVPLIFEGIDFIARAFGRPATDAISVKYAEVPSLLRLLALALPISAFEVVSNPLSVASGRPRAVLYSNIATVFVVIALLYPLSARFGLFGVVTAGLIGSMVSAAAFAVVLWPAFPAEMRQGLRWTLTTVACAALALVPVHAYAGHPWSWLSAVPAMLIFVAGLFAGRVIAVEDVRRALGGFRRPRRE